MPVLNYDSNTQRYEGLIVSNELEGSFVYPFWSFIKDDLISIISTITNVRIGAYNLVTPVLKITSSVESLPFISTPEPRYKFGSYSYGTFQEVSVDSEGGVTTFPFSKEPDYLIYERQQLKQCFVPIPYPDPIDQDYEVIFTSPTEDITSKAFTSRSSNQVNTDSALQGGTMFLNLMPGITADLAVFYEGRLLVTPNSEPRTAFISLL